MPAQTARQRAEVIVMPWKVEQLRPQERPMDDDEPQQRRDERRDSSHDETLGTPGDQPNPHRGLEPRGPGVLAWALSRPVPIARPP